MRHRKTDKILSRKSGPKKALLRSLVTSLLTYEHITTTKAKAQAARKIAEKAITLGKQGNLAARRQLLSLVYTETTVKKVMEVLAPRYQERKGGYTRVIKLGQRQGDAAEMVKLELV